MLCRYAYVCQNGGIGSSERERLQTCRIYCLPFQSLNSGASNSCLQRLVPNTPTPTTAHSRDGDGGDDVARAMTDDGIIDREDRRPPPNNSRRDKQLGERRAADDDVARADDGRVRGRIGVGWNEWLLQNDTIAWRRRRLLFLVHSCMWS